MNPDDNQTGPDARARAGDLVFGTPEMARLWSELPLRVRRVFILSAGRQWHDLWHGGLELDAIPPSAWGWRIGVEASPLALPSGVGGISGKPVSRARLVTAFAAWLFSPSLPFADCDRRRAVVAFGREAGMSRKARRRFATAIHRAARREAAETARELYSEILAETARLCRQSVGCRGVWLPDIRQSADEFRRDIEAALRAHDATHIKQSEVAQVTRTHLHGEDVVIKRHRFSKPGKRLKYLWRMSRARRAWAAGLALQRLGLPVAEPLGFLEVMRNGRVTDSYIINRWLPTTRTARELATDLRGAPRAERRRAIAMWRETWLATLQRGIYHADTKLSNALVQTCDAQSVVHWIDLECVHIGGRITPYRLLRNIVQMNGSLAADFPLRDRLWFLQKLPAGLRWLASHRANRIIAWWTARRLGNEKTGKAGP